MEIIDDQKFYWIIFSIAAVTIVYFTIDKIPWFILVGLATPIFATVLYSHRQRVNWGDNGWVFLFSFSTFCFAIGYFLKFFVFLFFNANPKILSFIGFGGPLVWLVYGIFAGTLLLDCFFSNNFSPRGTPDNSPWDFSPGSIGFVKDELDWQSAATTFSSKIASLNEAVTVVALQGGMGEGKSSYWRMTAEALKDGNRILDPKETLYTYISLTETNKAEDFSFLFANRWRETLEKRYSIISIENTIAALEPLVGSFTPSWFSNTLRILPGIANSLRTPTVCKTCDPTCGSTAEPSAEANRLFFGLPRIHEKRWLIVIDEIERAPFEEIMRLVETIERIKHVGRFGLPIPIVFAVCFSREEVWERLKKDVGAVPDIFTQGSDVNQIRTQIKTFETENTDERRRLLRGFFFEQKSFSFYEWLPLIKSEVKIDLIKASLDDALRAANVPLKIQWNLSTGIKTAGRSASDREPFHTQGIVLGRLIEALSKDSLRTIKRWSFQVARWYSSRLSKTSIRPCDILVMEYAKIKYPTALEQLRDAAFDIEKKLKINIELFKNSNGSQTNSPYFDFRFAELLNFNADLSTEKDEQDVDGNQIFPLCGKYGVHLTEFLQ